MSFPIASVEKEYQPGLRKGGLVASLNTHSLLSGLFQSTFYWYPYSRDVWKAILESRIVFTFGRHCLRIFVWELRRHWRCFWWLLGGCGLYLQEQPVCPGLRDYKRALGWPYLRGALEAQSFDYWLTHSAALLRQSAPKIREVDEDHLIFFESITFDDFVAVGFAHVPGGHEWALKSVLSYHWYNPRNLDKRTHFKVRELDQERLGCGGFLTEAGAA